MLCGQSFCELARNNIISCEPNELHCKLLFPAGHLVANFFCSKSLSGHVILIHNPPLSCPPIHHFIHQKRQFQCTRMYLVLFSTHNVSVCAVCSAPQLSVTAVSEIDTASDEVVHSITPSVVKQVWSMVQSAPTRPWWTALLPKGQSEEAILRQRYIRTYTH